MPTDSEETLDQFLEDNKSAAAIAFMPDGLRLVIPNTFGEDDDGEVPDHVLIAVAIGNALMRDRAFRQHVIEHAMAMFYEELSRYDEENEDDSVENEEAGADHPEVDDAQ